MEEKDTQKRGKRKMTKGRNIKTENTFRRRRQNHYGKKKNHPKKEITVLCLGKENTEDEKIPV